MGALVGDAKAGEQGHGIYFPAGQFQRSLFLPGDLAHPAFSITGFPQPLPPMGSTGLDVEIEPTVKSPGHCTISHGLPIYNS